MLWHPGQRGEADLVNTDVLLHLSVKFYIIIKYSESIWMGDAKGVYAIQRIK